MGARDDLHQSASFRPSNPEQANPDKVQKPSDMVCSRFPNTTFWGYFSGFGISAWSAMMTCFEGDRADRAAVIRLIRKICKGGVGSRSA